MVFYVLNNKLVFNIEIPIKRYQKYIEIKLTEMSTRYLNCIHAIGRIPTKFN